jgi:magnesium transporter
MKVNYYLVKDEVHGRPVEEIISSDLNGLKGKFHPTILSSKYHYNFIDISLEDETADINLNEEALQLNELLDVPLDLIEEIITDQRPRADNYSDFFLILFKFLTLEDSKAKKTDKRILEEEGEDEHQVGIIIRNNIVISVHKEIPIPIEKIFNRFKKYPMKISKGGNTFFVSTYLDIMIDHIYDLMRSWNTIINNYEKSILEHPKKDTLYEILDLKHRLLDLIKILQADREVINNIRLSNQDIFKTEEIPPELDDHIRHLLDETDIIRDLLTNLSDLYYNSDSANLNKTMKRFTIITSLILLPSLIAGIFGMNNITGGIIDFVIVVFVMILSVFVLYYYFKYKNLI